MSESRDSKRKYFSFGLAAALLVPLAIMYLSKRYLSNKEADPVVKAAEKEKIEKVKTEVLIMDEDVLSERKAAIEVRALPDNITISKFRERTRLDLGSVDSALQLFFSYHRRFSTDLVFIDWEPREEMQAKIGFIEEYRPAKLVVKDGAGEDPSRMDSDEFLETTLSGGSSRIHYAPNLEKINLADYAKFCRKKCTVSEKTYEVMAVLPLGDSGKVDIWIIDESREARQVWDGAAGKALPETHK